MAIENKLPDDGLPSDDELLRRIRAGGEVAFEARGLLHRKYKDLVHQVSSNILRRWNCDHVEGVKSEIWIRVFKNVGAVIDPNRLPVWLVKATKRHSIRHLKKFHGGREVQLEDGWEQYEAQTADPQRDLEAAERIKRLLAAAETISGKFREILELRLEELEFYEIALLLGNDPTNVKNIYYRGRHKLQKLLRDEPGGPRTRA